MRPGWNPHFERPLEDGDMVEVRGDWRLCEVRGDRYRLLVVGNWLWLTRKLPLGWKRRPST